MDLYKIHNENCIETLRGLPDAGLVFLLRRAEQVPVPEWQPPMTTVAEEGASAPSEVKNEEIMTFYLPLCRARLIVSRRRFTSASSMSTSAMRRRAVTACSGDPAK